MSDDTRLAAELVEVLRLAERTGDHAFAERIRLRMRDLEHDGRMRAELRQAITRARTLGDANRTQRLARALLAAEDQFPGWQADAADLVES